MTYAYSIWQNVRQFYTTCRNSQVAINAIRQILEKKYGKAALNPVSIPCNFYIILFFMGLLCWIIRHWIYQCKFTDDFKQWQQLEGKSLVVYANHCSHIDYLLLYSFMCANSVNHYCPIPIGSDHLNRGVFGWFFRQCGTSFIARTGKNNEALLKDFYTLLCQHKIPILFFPEGGWSTNGNLKSFKTGLLSIFYEMPLSITFVPIKLQMTRVMGDINFAHIRAQRRWNTHDSFYRALRSLPEFMRYKGTCYLHLGTTITQLPHYPTFIYELRKNLEQAAIIDELSQLIALVYTDMEYLERAELENKYHNHPEFDEFKRIFAWNQHSIPTIQLMLYYAFNQFIYVYLLTNNDLNILSIYSNFVFNNKKVSRDHFLTLPDFYRRIMQEINRCFNL